MCEVIQYIPHVKESVVYDASFYVHDVKNISVLTSDVTIKASEGAGNFLRTYSFDVIFLN